MGVTVSAFQPRRRADDPERPPPVRRVRLRQRLDRIDLVAVRTVLVTAIAVGLTLLAGNVFDRFVPALLLPVAAAVAAVTVAARVRWLGAIGRVALVVLAVGGTTVAVAAIAGGSFSDVIPRLADGPRRLLTTEWPSPRDPTVLATIAVLLGAATATAAALARRRDLHLTPLAPLAVGLVVLTALSAPQRPPWWLIGGLVAATAAFALARPGEPAARRLASLRGEHSLPIAALAVAAAAAATGIAVGWRDRADPRQVTDPASAAALLHPLEATVALRNADPAFALFTVVDESPLIGQRMPVRWRAAALDTYDGQRWAPRAAVRPIGDQLGRPDDVPDLLSPVRFRIEVHRPGIDFVPLPGRPLEVTSEPELGIETDVDRVVVKLAEEAPVGAVLHVVATPAPAIGEVIPAVIVAREPDELVRGLADTARQMAGEGGPIERLARLESEMRGWQLDRQAPGGGHQLRLIENFVLDTHRGTDEQFTTAFVLLARSLGYDARVATGFRVDADRASSPLTVRSDDAAAWPEVHVTGIGWVAFDPVPERETSTEAPPTPPDDSQSPAPAPPPVDDPAEPERSDGTTVDDQGSGRPGWGAIATWFTRVTFAISLVAVPLAAAIGAILAVKYARRHRRSRLTDPAEAVRGSWANVTDALVDAGLTIDAAWTDDRIAAMGAPLVGNAPPALARLAAMATAATFGPAPLGGAVHDAASVERMVTEAISGALTPVERLRWRLSLRSLRKASRSPVDV